MLSLIIYLELEASNLGGGGASNLERSFIERFRSLSLSR
jgi:hypothetical protein